MAAIWFMRLSAAICLAAIVAVLVVVGRDWYREAANDSALAAAHLHINSLGGSLSQDAVDSSFIVSLRDSAVTDAQIEELVALLRPLATGSSPAPDVPRMFAFNLAGTQVGDQGLLAISSLPVMWLNLNGTRITDQGLLHLRDQRQLSIVTISGTEVTRPGINAMRDSLPQVWVPVSDRGHPR